MRVEVLVIALAVTLASCSGGDTSATVDTTVEPTIGATTTTTTPLTTTTAPVTTTIDEGIDVEIRDGEVIGPDRFRYTKGEMVSITIVSDTPYEVHVHGYDLRYDLEPDVPLTVGFTADVPGIFEVETHPGQLLLFEIEVGG